MNLEKFYEQAFHWVVTIGPRIFLAIIILLLGIWLIRFLKKWFSHHLMQKQVNSSVRPFLINLIVIAMQVILLLTLMQVVGLQMTIFTALVGAFGVAAGLALSGTLQNFTSGILILFLKPFRVGENIIAQGQEGTVTSIQIFFTVLTTFDNRTVIIPNSKLSNEVIVNLSREGKRRLDIELKLSHSVPFDQAKATIEKSIDSIEKFLKDPARRIGVSSVEQDGYKLLINVWAPAHGFEDLRLLFNQRVLEDMKESFQKPPA
ncbi:MAG: mechanosensitive ion channel family protein [Flavisolibacter sp.]